MWQRLKVLGGRLATKYPFGGVLFKDPISSAPVADSFLLLEDGTSFLLLEDGVSKLII